MTTKQLSGWGYYRWSSDRQTEGDSKRRQTERIKEFAQRNNIQLLGMFGDEAVSAKDGKNLERQFAALLKALKPGQCIITENLDRISRQDAIDTLHFLKHDVILAKDATIFTVQDGQHYGKDNVGNLSTKLTAFLQSELAHQENQKKMERVKGFFTKAIAQIKQGIPVAIGSKLPSWIKVKDGKWDFVEEKKEIVQGIFRDFLAGVGMRTIAVRLNKAQTPALRTKTRKGKETMWSVSTITTLLRSDGVLGTLHFRDEEIKNAFPAIVSETAFLDVQVILQQHKNRHGKVTDDYRVSNLFRSLTRCAHCGGNVMVEKSVGHKGRKEKQERPYHYFACSKGRQGKCAAKNRINADRIENAFFVDCLGAAPSNLLTEDNKEALAVVAGIEEKSADVQRNIAKYLELMEKGMDFGKVQSRLAELREQEHSLAAELSEAKQRASSVSNLPQVLKDFGTLLHEDLASDETRKKVVNLMPYLVKDVTFNLGTKNPDFEVTFVNGVKWGWQGSKVVDLHGTTKGKKFAVLASIHEPAAGVWGNLIKESAPRLPIYSTFPVHEK